jgi:hypothetical protein
MLAAMQRTVAILTVVLCAAQPSACESGMYSGPPIAQPYSTTLRDVPATTAPSSPNAEVTLIELPEDEAWRRVKSTLGSRVLVLQPTALPQRFERNVVMLEYAYIAGDQVRYRIGYRAEGALLNFAAGAVNSAAPTATRTWEVRGVAAQYSTTSSWPERQIEWVEGSTWSGDDSARTSAVVFTIQARGVSEDELLQIVRGLVAVP